MGCQWLPLGKPEDRYKRYKKAVENNQKNVIKLEGIDGLWYEQPDILSKYKRRPVEIEEICHTHFSKMFKSGGRGQDNEDNEEMETEETPESHEDSENEEEKKFHFMIKRDGSKGKELPSIIKLNSSSPNETPFMNKRKHPAALRFHKVNKSNSPYNHFLYELQMYVPFRDESEFCYDDDNEIKKIYTDNFENIQRVKRRVMEHLEDVEEARYFVDEANKKLELEETGILLDTAKEQHNGDCQEEQDELHPDYVHIDTDHVENNEKIARPTLSIYRTIEMPDLKTLKENTRCLDSYQRHVINIGIQYAKDIVKAEREGNSYPDPPHMMVHGGAGTGKTFLIKTLAQWMQQILVKTGDGTCFPYVIKTAFTGTAASLIEGMTLHSAFSFSFENKHYSLSDKNRDAKRAALKNLKMIIIDEISMVKADMLYQLDLKLQEIREKVDVPFGGVAIFCFGDLLQLQPVAGRYIFDVPQGSAYYLTHSLMPRWHMLKVLNLEINHRQGKDKQYANMLNRIRVGKQTKEDIEVLEQRVRPLNHKDLKEVSLYIVCTKVACARINMEYLDSLTGNDINIPAVHHHRTQQNYKPRICKKEGTIGTTSFLNNLRIKMGCKVILIHNIDTLDCLTNGQLGVLTDVIRTKNGEIDKLIINFKNENVGKISRSRNPQLVFKYPKGTLIEKVSISYSLSCKLTTASSAVLIQFPIKIAQAITAQKIQGQTIPKPLNIAVDIASVFEAAQAYVMLSRIEALEQLYILEKLPENKIYASGKALEELEEMNKRSINNNPLPWNKNNNSSLKIATFNCMNLKKTHIDKKADPTLLKTDILLLQETWLTDDDKEEYNIDGFQEHFNIAGPGKGLAVYYRTGLFHHVADISQEKMQLTKFRAKHLDIISVYRSDRGTPAELLIHIKNLITPERVTIICGDLNICYLANRKNPITKHLEETNFKQAVKHPTHIKGRLLDHFYHNLSNGKIKDPTTYQYTTSYADHDAICVVINPEVNGS